MPRRLLSPPLWRSRDRNPSPPIFSDGNFTPQFPNTASQAPLPPPPSLPLPYENFRNLPTPRSMSTGFHGHFPSFDYNYGIPSEDCLPENLYSEPYHRPDFPYLYGDHYGSAELDIDMYEYQHFEEFDPWMFEFNEHLNHNQFPRVNSNSPSSGISCNYSEGRPGDGPNSSSAYSTNYVCGNHAVSAQNSHLPNLSAEMECNHARFSALPAFFTSNILKSPSELDTQSFSGRITGNSAIPESDSHNSKVSTDVLNAAGKEVNGILRDFHNVTDGFAQNLSGSEAQKQDPSISQIEAMKNDASSNHSVLSTAGKRSCTERTEGDQLNCTASLISSEQGSGDTKIMPLQKSSMAAETAVIDNHSTVIRDRKLMLDKLDKIICTLIDNLARLKFNLEILSDFPDEVFAEKNPAVEILDHSVESEPVIEEPNVLSDDDETEDSVQDSDKAASTKSSCNSDYDWEIIL